MNISLKWMQDFVDLLENDPIKIAEKLSDCSAEVEEIIDQSSGLKGVVIGEIKKISDHPDADRMQVTEVDIKSEVLQIVCGAKNIAVGQKVAVAVVGTVLPGDFKITETEKRGVLSSGMICAETELGLADESEGIMVLPKNAKLGLGLIDYLGLDDVIFNIENTTITNRPDLFSQIGFARELVVLGLAKFKNTKYIKMELANHNSNNNDFPLSINIEGSDLCSALSVLSLKNFKIEPSPQWLCARLQACGIRPINNLVDITNYIMLETGMPLHAFDLDLIKGTNVTMRLSKKGEKLITLDSEARELSEGIIILEDKEKIFDLCGIMGGENSGIKDTTSNVWLHAPVYNPVRIRRASISLNHRTDASVVYEKTVPDLMANYGLNRALDLILQLSPQVEVTSRTTEVVQPKLTERVINLSLVKLKRILAFDLELSRVSEILSSLSCDTELSGDVLKVTIPQFRLKDLEIEEDLIEEIVRVYGLKHIKAELPEIKMESVKSLTSTVINSQIRNILSHHSSEVLNYSFLGEELLKKSLFDVHNLIKLKNPLNKDLSFMRPSLLPYLLKNIAFNQEEGGKISLFEIAKVFNIEEIDNKKYAQEEMELAYISYDSDFYQAKEVLEELSLKLDLKLNYKESVTINNFSHPGQTADIIFQGKEIGKIFTVHPQVLKNFDLKQKVVYFYVKLGKIYLRKHNLKQFQAINKLPVVERDFNFLMARNILIGDFLKRLEKSSKLIINTSLVNIYEGKEIKTGFKNVCLRVVFQDKKETLNDNQIKKLTDTLIASAKKLGVELNT